MIFVWTLTVIIIPIALYLGAAVKITQWLRQRRLNNLRRQLASIEAKLEQERSYFPRIFPDIMSNLVSMRAILQHDIEQLEKRLRT